MTRFSNLKPLNELRETNLAKFYSYSKAFPDAIKETPEQHIAKYDELAKDATFLAALRVFRILTIEQDKLVPALNAAAAQVGYGDYSTMAIVDSDGTNRRVFMLPGSKPETIRVFPEIWVTSANPRHSPPPYNVGLLVTPYSVEFIKHWWERTKKHPQAWAPLSRGLTRMFKSVEVSVAVALTRYTSMKAYMSEATINKFAEVVVNFRRPAELVEARTPDDFMEMYWNNDTGPSSCMTKNGASRDWNSLPNHDKVHPCAWYSYTGKTYGMYLKKGNEIIARAIIYDAGQGDKPKWTMGRAYYSTTFAFEKFKQEARTCGINVDNPIKGMEINNDGWDFEVPVVNSRDFGPVVPIPFVDNVRYGFKLSLSNDKTKVRFVGDKSIHVVQVRTPVGYFSVGSINGAKCGHCGVMWNAARGIRTEDGHLFCSAPCAAAKEYISAKDDVGGNRYVKRENAYTVEFAGDKKHVNGIWYSTNEMSAMRAYGALSALHFDKASEILLDAEDDEVYRPAHQDVSITGNSGTFSRAIPVTATPIKVEGGRIYVAPQSSRIPFQVKLVKEVEFAENYQPISDELKALLDEAGRGFHDPEDLGPPPHIKHKQNEVAPGVLAGGYGNEMGKERKRPLVRFNP